MPSKETVEEYQGRKVENLWLERKVSCKQRKECFLTGRTDDLHCHHIYFGTGNREISDQNGFWDIWLNW